LVKKDGATIEKGSGCEEKTLRLSKNTHSQASESMEEKGEAQIRGGVGEK